jgi:hypothetical protein
MRRRPTAADSQEAPAVRFAWWMSFFATIALVAILGLARSAQAATSPAPAFPAPTLAAAFEEDEDEAEASEDDEGFEFEECVDFEECDESEEEGGPEAPEECLLSNAEASVSAVANRDQVRLQVRYRTSSPTLVAVDYGLHGNKGSLYLGGEKQRLGRTGVLRLSDDLTEAQMAKVMAAKGFTVRIRVPAAPRFCQTLFDRQLDDRQNTPTGPSWVQSE